MSALITRKIARNIAALIILQGGNYLLPLILVPYLVRTLGLSVFGDWVLACSFVAVSRTVVSYGFDLTATRAAAVNRDNPKALGELYSSILAVRIILYIGCLLVLSLMCALVPAVRSVGTLALVSMLTLVGEAMFPIWLFQGTEQMEAITRIRLSTRALFVCTVFVVVNSPTDVLLIPAVELLTSLLAGVVALKLAFKSCGLRLSWPSVVAVRTQFGDGAAVFVSSAAVHMYTTINTVVIGMVLGPVSVAQYSVAEKAYSAIRGLLGPFVQGVFPMLSRKHDSDPELFWRDAQRFAVAFATGLTTLAVVLWVSSGAIVRLIIGSNDPVATVTLRVFAASLVFASGSFLSPLLVIQGRGKRLLVITAATGFVNIATIFPVTEYFGAPGAATVFLCTQGFQVMLQLVANRRIFTRSAGQAYDRGRIDRSLSSTVPSRP